MSDQQKRTQGLLLAGLTVFLSAITMVLGAVPMQTLYLKSGPRRFFLTMSLLVAVSVAIGWLPLSLTIASLATLIFAFNWLNQRGKSLFFSGLSAVTAASFVGFSGIQAWLVKSGQSFKELVKEPVDQFLAQFSAVNGGGNQMVANDLIAQIPSGVVIFLIASLAIALFFEERMAKFFRIQLLKSRRMSFITLRLPDVFFWLLLGAVLATFLQVDWPETVRHVGSNVLNVLLVLYFFQGLAIVSVFFDTYRVSPLWRAIWYVFLILQLFLFVSCIGVVDFWFDFRQKLQKKTAMRTKVKDKGDWDESNFKKRR